MPSCACTLDNHSHEGTCGKEGFSLSDEHGSVWHCKECYDHFIAAKKAVIDFNQALMTIAMQQPDKLKEARDAVVAVIGGRK